VIVVISDNPKDEKKNRLQMLGLAILSILNIDIQQKNTSEIDDCQFSNQTLLHTTTLVLVTLKC
jgi:hypothetical protein